MFVRRFCFYDSAAMNLKKYGGRPSSAVFSLLLMKTKKNSITGTLSNNVVHPVFNRPIGSLAKGVMDGMKFMQHDS